MSTVLHNDNQEQAVGVGIIDCDVHVHPLHPDVIKAYLSQPWKHRFQIWQNTYYKSPVEPTQTVPPGGGKPGTDVDFLRMQLLEGCGIATAILLPRASTSIFHDPDHASAVATAYNHWLSETWLGTHNADGAFKGSITIAHQDPAAAAKEIDRWAGKPHFVQVLMDSGARAPFGQRQYYPIYEACARHGLPLAIHPGTDGMGTNILASQGYPSHFLEYYAGVSFAMQTHLLSLLTEGVFERFPDLKIVFTEGGVAWLPALMWRLDQEYKGLRSEIPWLKKRPSDYLRDHVRLTTQPLERPVSDRDLQDLLSMFDYEHMLLYSSDYPDEHFASPDSLSFLAPDIRCKLLSDNAKQLYRL
ncbi:amidohydrolase [Paenibacillus sp. WQ 127069]|uniref:Amidohydrolase n=1 Tax=Paenibacillus baimaensis TaxID=2982185 RepID=A0ABT2U8D2_9BACL|nr:amidohydrolase family protein [Paenibacillus sp. WQ 127069]MCU6790888.1 amidohydrolase [Paenibacillus sp. WQ 127069]